jgi:hypothetical protein
MLIKYKPKVEHVKTIPLIPNPKEPKSYSRNLIQLLPGTNEVTEDEWEAIKPHVAQEIKDGEIVPFAVKTASRSVPDGKARNLKDVPANIARDIIEKCVNPATLKKWYGEETRDEVHMAISKRMRTLKLDPDEIQKEIEKAESNGDTLDEEIDPEGGGAGKKGKKQKPTSVPNPDETDDADTELDDDEDSEEEDTEDGEGEDGDDDDIPDFEQEV